MIPFSWVGRKLRAPRQECDRLFTGCRSGNCWQEAPTASRCRPRHLARRDHRQPGLPGRCRRGENFAVSRRTHWAAISCFRGTEGSRASLEPTFAMIARDGLQALYVSWNPLFNVHRATVTFNASKLRLPTIYGFREFVQSGGLMSYGPDLPDQYRRAAAYVDKILKGARAAELPLQVAAKYELVINLKTANTLGLEISPTLLALADEVIE